MDISTKIAPESDRGEKTGEKISKKRLKPKNNENEKNDLTKRKRKNKK